MDDLFKRLMEFTGDGVFCFTVDEGRFTFANQGFVDIFDLDCAPEDVVGKVMTEAMVYLEKEGTIRRALAEHGEIHRFPYHFKTLKGEEKWVLHDSFVTRDPDTGEQIVEAIVKDVTAAMRAEAALAHEHNLLRTLIDSLPDCVYFKDTQSRFVVANQTVAALMGAETPDDLLGKTDFEFYPKPMAERFQWDEAEVVSTGQPLINREELVVDSKGGGRWFSTSKAPIRDASGEIIGVVGVSRDITKHRQVEEALVEALQRFEAVVESTPLVAIQGFDQAGTIRHWNAACATLYGFRSEEILGRRLQDVLLDEANGREFERLIERVWTSGKATEPQEWPIRTRNGDMRWVYSTIFPVFEHGRITELFCMDVDVTERRRAEEALRLDESRLEALLKLDQMSEAPLEEITDFALEEAIRLASSTIGYLAYLNDDESVLHMYAFSRVAMKECMIRDKPLYYPVETTGLWGEAVRQRQPIITNDYAAPSPLKKGYPEGHVEVIRHLNVPIFDGDRIVIVAGVGNKPTDYDESDVRQLTLLMTGMWRIIQQKNAGQALKESEHRYHTLFELFPDAIFLVAQDGTILDCNSAACGMFDRDCLELAGRNVTEVIPGGAVSLHADGAPHPAHDEKTRGEAVATRKNGESFPVEAGTRWLALAGQSVALVHVRDITERKQSEQERRRLEAQIQQAQKLESLGVLAGGIAHDFNNLLTGILGHASLALMELSPVSPALDSVKQIETTARRAADLTRQMLAYSGKGRFVVQPIRLSEVVEEMSHLLEVSISKKCTLKYQFPKGVPLIDADVSQVRQVVMNLIINASEAIGEHNGVITLRTGVEECDRAYLAGTYLDEQLAEGPYAFLEVMDTGCGMTPETRERLFDPFFTTKFTGRGLGLAALLGIVRGHRGAVKVYSELGRGTTIKVLFPVSKRAAIPEPPPEPAIDAPCGTGTVLVVDDEQVVRDLAEEVLRDAGFTVLVATDGCEAVEIFRSRPDEIRAVLLDLTMPNMDGEETFAVMRHIRSDVRVILSSGYNEQDATERFAGKGLAGFIHKPYAAADLVRMFCSLLRQAPEAAPKKKGRKKK